MSVLEAVLLPSGMAKSPSSESSSESSLSFIGLGEGAKATFVSVKSKSGPYDFLDSGLGLVGCPEAGLAGGLLLVRSLGTGPLCRVPFSGDDTPWLPVVAGVPAIRPTFANAAPIPCPRIGPEFCLLFCSYSSAMGSENRFSESSWPVERILSPDFLVSELTFVNVVDSAGAVGGLRSGTRFSCFLSSNGDTLGLSKSMIVLPRKPLPAYGFVDSFRWSLDSR